VNAIRSAKAARLASFQVTHPGTTLTSSSSNTHIRRALQALPHDPASTTPNSPSSKKSTGGKPPRRGKVDHFVPAIWVPDQKTETCMRCNTKFGWRRRRHHCRLCGRVVCASCSESVGSPPSHSVGNSDHPSRHSTSPTQAITATLLHLQGRAMHAMKLSFPFSQNRQRIMGLSEHPCLPTAC
jgi:FYVE/RhoGEF/PH domain-containing protein 5/6